MKAHHRKRLLKLATFLETEVPRKHFDMEFYGQGDFNHHACGSSACAMGWATVALPRVFGGRRSHWGGLTVSSKKTGRRGLSAAVNEFGIDHATARTLFLSRPGHTTPKQVARAIRKVAAQ